jgi:hypothetical protein
MKGYTANNEKLKVAELQSGKLDAATLTPCKSYPSESYHISAKENNGWQQESVNKP